MKKNIAFFLTLGLGLCPEAFAQIQILKPWVRATSGPNAAVYMQILNTSPDSVLLNDIETEVASKAEIHTHSHDENGLMRMKRVNYIDITPRQPRFLKPGGEHIMLIKINRPLKEGDKVILSLGFNDGERINVVAPVIAKAGD